MVKQKKITEKSGQVKVLQRTAQRPGKLMLQWNRDIGDKGIRCRIGLEQ